LGALYDVGLSGEERIVGISQGWKLTGAIKTAKRKLDDKSLRHSGQNLMAWAVANARVEPKATPSSSPSRHLARRRSTHCPFPTSSREGERAALVAFHKAGVADNVCGQDRQFALLTGHWATASSVHLIDY